MFSGFRTFEIALYALINFLPYLALTIYCFYHSARFRRPLTVLICILAVAVQMGTRFWSIYLGQPSTLGIVLFRLFVYTLLMYLAIKSSPGKILFVELIFTNISSFILIFAMFLKGVIFTGKHHNLYCWHSSLIILLLHLCITLPFTISVHRRMRTLIDKDTPRKVWTYYWLIPLTFLSCGVLYCLAAIRRLPTP